MENRTTIKIAEKVIEIRAIHSYFADFCKEYAVADRPDYSITIMDKDIDYEREKSEKEDIREGNPVRRFSDEYLETLAVYRKIADKMTDWDRILFHGSVISVDGEGYLFTAKSGTGKSTHTRLWREYFGQRAVMINDDKPLLGITGDGVTAYGTPWDGKHRLSTNQAVPLKGICILSRDKENRIEPIEKRSAFPMMVQQTYRSVNPEKIKKSMELLDRMMDQVPVYRLFCNMEPEAARVAYEGMERRKK